MNIYLSNAFSLQMFSEGKIEAVKISLTEAKKLVGIRYTDSGWSAGKDIKNGVVDKEYLPATSVIGHADICNLINTSLGMTVGDTRTEWKRTGFRDQELITKLYYGPNRISIKLNPGDKLIVGQYIGPRLAEGTKELPADAKIEWYLVTLTDTEKEEKAAKRIEEELEIADAFHRAALAQYYDGDPGAIEEAVKKCFPGLFENMGD